MSKSLDNRFQWSIIGHSNIVSYLQNNLANGKVSHAYLFVGPRHLGKTLVAQNFINSLVCENLHQGKGLVPCGQCQCCQQVANRLHPDIFWVEREINEKKGKLKKNISIEQMRELQNKLSLHSFLNSYKVAVINEAESLNQEAANSLLKTLEEPTPKTVIILLATSIYSLPRTIVSRCQIIKFLPVSEKEIFEHLKSLKVERKKAKVLTALAAGLPGKAINYLKEPETYTDFSQQIKQLIFLMQADINDRFKTVGELISGNDADALKDILVSWTKVLRDLILIKNSIPSLISNLNLTSDLTKLAQNYKSDDLLKMVLGINLAKRYLAANVNPRLILENLVLTF